jgi:hypothetical protein
MDLKCVWLDMLARPYRAQELVLCDEPAGRSDKNFEAVERANAKRHDAPVGPKLATVKVDRQSSTRVQHALVPRWHRVASASGKKITKPQRYADWHLPQETPGSAANLSCCVCLIVAIF